MEVKVKFRNEEVKELYRKASGELNTSFPFKKHERDFCYDCVAVSCEEVAPKVYKYDLGIALQLEGVDKERPVIFDIDARPRSSVYKTGMSLSNCIGTIDEDYTGYVSVIFYHVIDTLPKYEVGDRICQIKIGTTYPMNFVEVDDLNVTKRGDGGFGSTGKSELK